jgi:DNA-binding NarL/FixJ family response regulator
VTTRVLIGDDHPIVRSGLRQLIDREPDFEVVAEAADGAEAVAKGLDGDVELAILDVAMPRLTGLQAARELTRRKPDIRVLMLSMYDNDEYLAAAMRSGAAGYVLKSVVDRDIISACRAVLAGTSFIYPRGTSARVRDHLERARRDDSIPEDILTSRELEVLKLIAEGRSAQQIAETLCISIKTVDRHRANIMDKLSLRDRVQLTRYAIRRGLIEP